MKTIITLLSFCLSLAALAETTQSTIDARIKSLACKADADTVTMNVTNDNGKLSAKVFSPVKNALIDTTPSFLSSADKDQIFDVVYSAVLKQLQQQDANKTSIDMSAIVAPMGENENVNYGTDEKPNIISTPVYQITFLVWDLKQSGDSASGDTFAIPSLTMYYTKYTDAAHPEFQNMISQLSELTPITCGVVSPTASVTK